MKKKILCLHGYSMNSDWMAEWCRPLEVLLNDFELIIPCAPVPAPETEVRAMCQQFNMPIPESRIGVGKNWCWYRATEDKPPVYKNIEQSLQMLSTLFRAGGCIDGVIGWSQGTVMAAILAGLHIKANDARFRFNWTVLCGGFRPGDARFRPYFDTPLALPSLHVIGERESAFMRSQGERLALGFEAAEILLTPVGHIMPIKHPRFMEKMAEWILKTSR